LAICAGLAGTLAICLAGCGEDVPAAVPTTAAASAPLQDRAQLAARAAAAKDLRYAALYTLSSDGRPDRTVVVTRASDGGWRVDIPGGALGGTADVSVSRTRDGLFQCALPSADRLVNPVCVRVAEPDGQLDGAVDPQVQHIFVDWLDVLTDRQAAIAVSAADGPPGVRGACFSVESNSASLAVPVDVGIYCYEPNGTLTGARLSFGRLTLTGALAPPPPTITLPGAVIDADPLPMASPPPPPTTQQATPSP
jgi:hypothetical protein